MTEVTSNLWIASRLAMDSFYFPLLVEAACQKVGVEYSSDMVWKCATHETVTGAINMDITQTADESLRELIVLSGADVDQALEYIVASTIE